jgi:hypothetical protein
MSRYFWSGFLVSMKSRRLICDLWGEDMGSYYPDYMLMRDSEPTKSSPTYSLLWLISGLIKVFSSVDL